MVALSRRLQTQDPDSYRSYQSLSFYEYEEPKFLLGPIGPGT